MYVKSLVYWNLAFYATINEHRNDAVGLNIIWISEEFCTLVYMFTYCTCVLDVCSLKCVLICKIYIVGVLVHNFDTCIFFLSIGIRKMKKRQIFSEWDFRESFFHFLNHMHVLVPNALWIGLHSTKYVQKTNTDPLFLLWRLFMRA